MMNQSARQAFESETVSQRPNETPPDRCSEIRRLLLDIMAQGPWQLEQRIDALGILRELSDDERDVVHQIYQTCYDAAEREADEKKMWRYQRLLRGMVLQKNAAPAVDHRRPDPLFCLEPRMEFAVESEDAVIPSSDHSPTRPAVEAVQRSAPLYDAVFPACLFAAAVFVSVLTFTSGAVDPSTMPATLASGPGSEKQTAVSTRPEPTTFMPTELQVADAVAASEAEKVTTVVEPAATATNNGASKEPPKPVSVPPRQEPAPAAAILPRPTPIAIANPPMPKPVEPTKPTSESTQTDREVERTAAPARRSLGPSLATPELEAQLEALKNQRVGESRE
ncbi:MAG: hypothetical protein FJ145_15920 [Deltaproteobacteria bacterium]|nr:hypothetical protein [Deltaproteobacteria bacterium]